MRSAVTIPFANLARGAEELGPELEEATLRVLRRGWYVLGDECRAFEEELAEAFGARHAVGVASGTDAIEVALRALGVGSGDEVVTQANTCVPTVAGIERSGATPVLCDVDPATGTMDPRSLAVALRTGARAVVPVHLYGQVGDLHSVLALADDRGIPVVEDCAQAHGAALGHRTAGTMGVIGAFSFYPTKNLGAAGDGGAVVTDDPGLDERLRLVRQYGQSDRYHHVAHGVNSRLDELQAALLRVKLPLLARWNARRRTIAARYDAALADTPVRPLTRLAGRTHAYHLYVVRAPARDAFRAALSARGVATLLHYPRPVHGHEPYRSLGQGPVPLPNAEALAREVVSLPLYPELTDDEVEHTASASREAAVEAEA